MFVNLNNFRVVHLTHLAAVTVHTNQSPILTHYRAVGRSENTERGSNNMVGIISPLVTQPMMQRRPKDEKKKSSFGGVKGNFLIVQAE